MKIELDQRDLDDISKASAAWERYEATDTESPEWDEVRREWDERRSALAFMLIRKTKQ